MRFKRLSLVLAVLLSATLACSLLSGGGSKGNPPSGEAESPGEGQAPEAPAGNSSGKYDTEFPLPSDVQNFTKLSDKAINYQTSLTITEMVKFYRSEFASAGYTEREITTVINDTTFSIVWDGHPSGKALVVQGVDLGDGTVNVNVRFEDV